MKKTSGRVTSCCVALFFTLTSVSAVQKRHSINGLKNIDFEQSVPKHSLVLLYWFANTVSIDNNVIWLTFDPNGDYGSHRYYNEENLLSSAPLSRGYKYYTIGNLNRDTPVPFPHYVFNPPIPEYVETNMDRIIICVREQNSGWGALQRIDQVYITQHRENQRTYDREHTYQITTNLLRQIREFSVGQNQQQLQRLRNDYESNADDSSIRKTWGDLAGLALLLFIVIQEKYSSTQHNRHENGRNQLDGDSSESKSNDSRDFRNQDESVVYFHNDEEDHQAIRMIANRKSGGYHTLKPRKNTQRSPCCICCIVSIVLISLCVIGALLYYFMKK
ncbi:uncharacterized protein LOC117250875 [Epinephelus lanceolatus]